LLNEISWNQILSLISSIPNYNLIADNLDKITENLAQIIFNLISSTASSLPNLFINLLIVIFTTYYLLIDWESLEARLTNLIPFSNKKQILSDSKKITHEIVFGTLIVALVETIIASLGFYLLGVKFYLVLGLLVGLLAFIPLAGPVFIWFPALLFELAIGNYPAALGILLLGLILSFGIDFFLRVKILGSRTQIHPVIMLFGVLGGVQIFGLMGFIVGPLILSIAITIINSLPKNKK
jgi:predicted PurR-regulated permease PerM